MNSYKRILLSGIIFILGYLPSYAQSDIFTVTYNMAVPNHHINDYVSEASYLGGEIGYRHFFNSKFSVGFNVGAQQFDQSKGFNSYYSENSALSGEEYRYTHSYSMMATAYYYFIPDSKIKPYAGVGLGTTCSQYENLIGGILLSDSFWAFSFAPEVGAMVPLFNESGICLITNIKYNYSTGNQTYDSYGYWGFNIGFSFSL